MRRCPCNLCLEWCERSRKRKANAAKINKQKTYVCDFFRIEFH